MKINKSLIALSLTGMLGAASSAQALTFDTNGILAGGQVNNVSTLDWSPSSALAVGTVNAQTGSTFQLLSQGFLTNFTDSNGNAILANNGLNSNYQVTFVTSFEESVLSSTGFPGAQVFSTTGSTTAPNFFEIYLDTALDANVSTGTGFNNGILIANGTILAGGIGSFATVYTPGTLLDQFGGDKTGGITSVGPGSGGTTFGVTVGINSYDPNYFSAVGELNLNFNTSQVLPFKQVDPADLFTTTHNAVLGASGLAPTQAGWTTVGAINGISGPNLILQVDANTSVTTNVPEPAVLSLFGLGLLGMGFSRRRS